MATRTTTCGPRNTRARVVAAVLGAIALTAASDVALAEVKCTVKLEKVRTENDNGKILAMFNETWHVIATGAQSADVKQQRLSIAMGALLSGSNLELFYEDGYDCKVTNHSHAPSVVQISR